MPREVLLHRPGLVDYRSAWRWQQEAVEVVRGGDPERLALLQHPPVYTLGRRAGRRSLLLDPDVLSSRGAEVIETDRGGDATFHGPGQLVAYPILDLQARGLGAADYVRLLEEAMLLTVAAFGILATRRPGAPGVWTARDDSVSDAEPFAPAATVPLLARRVTRGSEGEVPWAKLGAVGVRLRGGVSSHGLALNVETDLAWFDAIVPCGLPGVGVISMARLLRGPMSLPAVEDALLEAFAALFDCRFIESDSELPRNSAQEPALAR